MRWFKGSDWIPLSNAKAIVEFWEKDLQYAIDYLDYVNSFKGKGLPNWHRHLKIADDDVEKSKKELAKAIKKLEETKKREGIDG
jgi:hypothetical protein